MIHRPIGFSFRCLLILASTCLELGESFHRVGCSSATQESDLGPAHPRLIDPSKKFLARRVSADVASDTGVKGLEQNHARNAYQASSLCIGFRTSWSNS